MVYCTAILVARTDLLIRAPLFERIFFLVFVFNPEISGIRCETAEKIIKIMEFPTEGGREILCFFL